VSNRVSLFRAVAMWFMLQGDYGRLPLALIVRWNQVIWRGSFYCQRA